MHRQHLDAKTYRSQAQQRPGRESRLIDDERRRNAAGLLASLHMLVMTEGGFDFSAAACKEWMRDAGFHDLHVEPLTDVHSMVVGTK